MNRKLKPGIRNAADHIHAESAAFITGHQSLTVYILDDYLLLNFFAHACKCVCNVLQQKFSLETLFKLYAFE